MVRRVRGPTGKYIYHLPVFPLRYTHYHANDLLSSETLGEPQDLLLYTKAARLAQGEDVDYLLGSDTYNYTSGSTSHTISPTALGMTGVGTEGTSRQGGIGGTGWELTMEEKLDLEVSKSNVQFYENWLRA